MSSDWDPAQYARFRAERQQPFFDLLDLVRPIPGGRAVDLGCGTGELTRHVHERSAAAATLGVDRSQAMLAESAQHAGSGLRFERGDIGEFSSDGLNLVFSNAAMHWLPDHASLFARLARTLAPAGQLAVQMPANHGHPSHKVAHAVAREPRHARALNEYVREDSVQDPEWYAALLARLGFAEQHVRLQVYLHRLAAPEEVVEWVKGSLLTDYRARMSAEDYAAYLADYRERLLAILPDERPYLLTFKRILLWGRMGTPAEGEAGA